MLSRHRFLPVLFCLLSSWAFAASPPLPIDRIEQFVREEMQRQKVPGVAIAVVQGGEAKLTRIFPGAP